MIQEMQNHLAFIAMCIVCRLSIANKIEVSYLAITVRYSRYKTAKFKIAKTNGKLWFLMWLLVYRVPRFVN